MISNIERLDEEKKNAAIGLLPCVFPAGRKNRKRCSIDEALKSFIDCQPVSVNILHSQNAPLLPHYQIYVMTEFVNTVKGDRLLKFVPFQRPSVR